MSQAKKNARQIFRDACLTRDGKRCKACGIAEGAFYDEERHNMPPSERARLDVHHVTPRKRMPGGGYVMENGITLCESCHVIAEAVIGGASAVAHWSDLSVADRVAFAASRLYEMIGSSYETALRACEAAA